MKKLFCRILCLLGLKKQLCESCPYRCTRNKVEPLPLPKKPVSKKSKPAKVVNLKDSKKKK